MIVIRASGSTDVKALKKLAKALSAEPARISVEEDPPEPRRRKPMVSPLSAARIAPAAHGAIMELGAKAGEEGGPEER